MADSETHSPSKHLETLRTHAREASQRVRAARNSLRFRQDSAPQLGDTFLFHQTAEPSVQWAVIESDPSDEDRFLTVPVDGYPQVGSYDVEIHADDPLRVANARCHLGISLPNWSFDTHLRAGILGSDTLQELQQKYLTIQNGQLESSLAHQVVDSDPDYLRWTAALRRMGKRLEETIPKHSGVHPPPNNQSTTAESRSSTTRYWRGPLAMAASVVLAVGLWSLHQKRHWQDLLESERQDYAELVEINRKLEQRFESSGGSLETLREQVETLGREARVQRDALVRLESESAVKQALIEKLKRGLEAAARPVGQLAAVTLNDRSRSSRGTVKITDATDSILLQLEPTDPNIYPDYELRIIDEKTGERVITSRALAWHRQYLGVVLPAELFRSAESTTFNLELWATVNGEFQQVDTGYRLWISNW